MVDCYPFGSYPLGSQQLGICALEFFCNLTIVQSCFERFVCWGFVGFLELLATCEATSFVCTWDLKQDLETCSFGVSFLMLTTSSRSSLCFMYHYGLGLASFSFIASTFVILFTIFDFHSQVWIQYHLLLLFFGVLFLVFLCLFCHKSILVKMESWSFRSLGCFWFLIFFWVLLHYLAQFDLHSLFVLFL